MFSGGFLWSVGLGQLTHRFGGFLEGFLQDFALAGDQSLNALGSRLISGDQSFYVLPLDVAHGVEVNLLNLEVAGDFRELIDYLGWVKICHDLGHLRVMKGKGSIGHRYLHFDFAGSERMD